MIVYWNQLVDLDVYSSHVPSLNEACSSPGSEPCDFCHILQH
ncbi:unnamed protein product [Arabidopsis lyrata]|nr:unnamed protein product [Arabidopsis lyrata]